METPNNIPREIISSAGQGYPLLSCLEFKRIKCVNNFYQSKHILWGWYNYFYIFQARGA